MCWILCYNSDMGNIKHQVLAIWKDKAVVEGTLIKKDPECPTNTKKKGGEVPKDFPTQRWRSAAGKQDQKKKPDPGPH